ncbi:unnamed protein product, partial [Rotaria sp. Silwood2]
GTRINYNQISEDELELLRNYRPELLIIRTVGSRNEFPGKRGKPSIYCTVAYTRHRVVKNY